MPAELVYQDDFSTDTSWYTEENKRFSLVLTDEGYKISINILDAPIWSIREQSFDDVIVEVDTTRLSGAKSGYSGLVCRHQDGENYYALVISSDGTFGIAKMEGGEFEFIRGGQRRIGCDQERFSQPGACRVHRGEAVPIRQRSVDYCRLRMMISPPARLVFWRYAHGGCNRSVF